MLCILLCSHIIQNFLCYSLGGEGGDKTLVENNKKVYLSITLCGLHSIIMQSKYFKVFYLY